MKKKGLGLLLLVLLLCLFAAGAQAAVVANDKCGAEGNHVLWSLDDQGVLTISGTGAMADYEIVFPDEDDYTISYLSYPWLDYANDIRHVKVQNGVTRIGDMAFFECASLQTVELASTVGEVGESAFNFCSSLTQINLPSRITALSDYVLAHCSSLEDITLPPMLSSIGSYAFLGCTALADIEIPSQVKSIGNGAFEECASLTSIALPDSVTALNYALFRKCSNLESVTVSENALTIGSYIFYNCPKLQSFTIPARVTKIPEYAFYNCYKLASVTLPEGLHTIEENAFYSNYELTSIVFPATIGWIDENAFYGCSKLSEMRFAGSAPLFIDERAFRNVKATVSYPSNNPSWTADKRAQYGGTLTWTGYTGSAEVTDVIAAGVCGTNLAWELNNDGVLTISGFGDMDDYPFVSEKLADSYTVSSAPWGNYTIAIRSLVVENGVTSIGDYAFQHCQSLSSLSIPKSLVNYGEGAFYNCDSIQSFDIPYGIRTVPEKMFFDCNGLQRLSIPSTVTTIEESAFSYAAIQSVSLPDSLTTIEAHAFGGTHLTSVKIPNSVTSLGVSAFATCMYLEDVQLGSGLTSIPDSCFSNTLVLDEVIIPATIDQIDSWAFMVSNQFASSDQDLPKHLYFDSDMPSFADDAFEKADVVIHYPYGNTTWDDYITDSVLFGGNAEWDPIYPETPIDQCQVKLHPSVYSYTGQAIKPADALTVTYNGRQLTEGEDYTLSYQNNINAGTATITIDGKGSFRNSTTKNFTIIPIWGELEYAQRYVDKTTRDAAFTIPFSVKKTDGKITYSSTDTSVATVNSSGLVTIRGEGETQIFAKAAAGINYTSAYALFDLTVEQVGDPPTMKKLTYSFVNMPSHFGYPSNYRIPLSRYKLLFSSARARELYDNAGPWGGSCYGMSATASLLSATRTPIATSDFGRSVNSALKVSSYSSSLGMDLTEFIEAGQVSWWLPTVNQNRCYGIDNICQLVLKEKRAGRAVVLAVYDYYGGGHGIVAYDIVKVNSTTSRMLVYDPNYPNDSSRHVKLTTNAAGEYIGWYYNINDCDPCRNDYGRSSIHAIPFAGYRALIDALQGQTGYALSDDPYLLEALNTLFISLDDFRIENMAGDVLATMKNGVFNSRRDKITLSVLPDSDMDRHTIDLPTGTYRIVSTKDGATLEATMVNYYQSASVTTTAKSVIFDVCDARNTNMVYIEADEDDSFGLTLESELESAEGMEKLEFSGISSGATVELGVMDGELHLANCDNLSMHVNGQLVSTAELLLQKTMEACEIELEYKVCGYTGEAREPAVTVRNGDLVLQRGLDYTVVYADNTEIGTAAAAVYGKGSYSGTAILTFDIVDPDGDACASGHHWDRGVSAPDETNPVNTIVTYTCTVCGATTTETVYGYAYKLDQSVSGAVSISLTNNLSRLIDGELCIVACDASGSPVAFGMQKVELGVGETGSHTIALPDGSSAVSVKAFIVNSQSLIPEGDTWTHSL